MMTCDDIYKTIQGVLPQGWETGRTVGRKTFKLKNVPISKKIHDATRTDIMVQFYRHGESSNLKLEFVSKEDSNSTTDARSRESLASRFRKFVFLNNPPTWLIKSEGASVLHVTLNESADENKLIMEFFKLISEKLEKWVLEITPDLLPPQSKIAELSPETAKMRTVARMVKTAKDTVAGANGQETLQKVKEKENRFATDGDFNKYVSNLLETQNGLCAITRLPLQFDAQVDDQELQASLDRIDSNGHYEPGNLQIVCRFINRWKSDGNDAEFRRLMALVGGSGTSVMAQPLGGSRCLDHVMVRS